MYSDILKHILVPIDLDENTVFSVKQAIELSIATGATIHLLHVIETPDNKSVVGSSSNDGSQPVKELMKKLSQWKYSIEETISGSKVRTHIAEGSVYDNILVAANKIHPQLIILGRARQRNFFTLFRPVPLSPNDISIRSHCPVLTIMNKAANNKIQNIVVPVRSFIPKRKVELLLVFARMYRAKIHLVTLDGHMGESDSERTALLDTYRLLKNGGLNYVEYHLLRGQNLPKATLKYAKNTNADMIFVNPGVETKTSFFLGKHINELLPIASGLKFLFVEPSPEKSGSF